MPLAIKHFASDTNVNTASITLYTVPAGRLAKIIVSNLLTVSGASASSLVVGNVSIPPGTTYKTTGGAAFQPPRPLEFYIGAGQTVTVARTGSASVCTVQFVAIEEAAA